MIWEFFESCIIDNPNFIDAQDKTPIQELVLKNDLQELKRIINIAADPGSGGSTLAVKQMLESRDRDGRTPFFLAV